MAKNRFSVVGFSFIPVVVLIALIVDGCAVTGGIPTGFGHVRGEVIYVNSKPDSASIYIDDRNVGVTPTSLDVGMPDSLRIRIVKEGFKAIEIVTGRKYDWDYFWKTEVAGAAVLTIVYLVKRDAFSSGSLNPEETAMFVWGLFSVGHMAHFLIKGKTVTPNSIDVELEPLSDIDMQKRE